MRGKNRKPIASCLKLPQFTTMNVIDGQAGLILYASLIFYSLTINNILNIIALLILAAVSIATLTGENGILKKANDAKNNNTVGEEQEQIGLAYNAVMADNKGSGVTAGQLQEELQKYDSEITVDDEGDNFKVTFPNGHVYTVNKNGTIDDSAVGGTTPPTTEPTMLSPGDTATKTETDNYEDTNHDKATIPKDFTVSKEDNTIKDGLVVIGPDGSEFVWVPVENIDTMAKKTLGKDGNGNDNYEGKLYYFTAPSEGTGPSTSRENPNDDVNTAYGQGTTSYREPSLVTGGSNDVNSTATKALYESEAEIAGDEYDKTNASAVGYTNAQEFGKAMQEDYNSMIASVITYKGFYVGRYEMSLTGASRGGSDKEPRNQKEMFYLQQQILKILKCGMDYIVKQKHIVREIKKMIQQ